MDSSWRRGRLCLEPWAQPTQEQAMISAPFVQSQNPEGSSLRVWLRAKKFCGGGGGAVQMIIINDGHFIENLL